MERHTNTPLKATAPHATPAMNTSLTFQGNIWDAPVLETTMCSGQYESALV